MIITPEFVFIHLSKTGGTFVEAILKNMFSPNIVYRGIYSLRRRYNVRIPFFKYCYKELEQHAWCKDIPKNDVTKQIVSIIRNPYDLYVSEYTFDWWRKYQHRWFWDLDAVKEKYPNYVELDFNGFVVMSWEFASWINRTLVKHPKAKLLGWYTHKFVYYYCSEHDYVFEAADDHKLFVERVKEKMFDVHFIRQHQLNKDFYDLLSSHGYPHERIKHILNKGKINVSRERDNFRMYYNDWLLKEVRKREALLFDLFPEFDD